MKCDPCTLGFHPHRGQCFAAIYQRISSAIGESWIGCEIVGVCACVGDSTGIEAQRKAPVDALRAGIDYALAECLNFTMNDTDGHVTCVDGDADTQDMAETLFEHLRRAGWLMINGGVKDGS